MTQRLSPQRWANTLTLLLNAAYGTGPDRFPVKVPQLALDFSRQRFPDDPITMVTGSNLPDFDGALVRAPDGRNEWGIVYNDGITSSGRINFTLAHELGHYLLHRQDHPDGIECSTQDMVRWDSAYHAMEKEANVFAATLLMPLDDFRAQIDARKKPSIENLGACATRYRVSLTAAALRWLTYTERRSVLVASRDGFILWARPSDRALKTGAFIRTVNRSPVAVPAESPTRIAGLLDDEVVRHPPGIWFPEACEESVLITERYDFAFSLLHLDDASSAGGFGEEVSEDVFDRMTGRSREINGT